MMRNIKITIEYDGTNLQGWQIQKNGERTVQGEIKKAIKKIFSQDVSVIGSGRTDSGVHALGQVANFKVRTALSLEEIHNALNGNLPKDIAILDVKEVPPTFHAQYSAKEKTYRYTILNRPVQSPMNRQFSLHYRNKLNRSKMRQEAHCLIGRHDFKSFQASDAKRRDKTTSVRTIKELTIKKRGDLILIEITANGFLYKMVRNIVGTLLEIGSGKHARGHLSTVLNAKDRKMAGPTAPAKGLSLVQVKYRRPVDSLINVTLGGDGKIR